jgi:hypothetical protein
MSKFNKFSIKINFYIFLTNYSEKNDKKTFIERDHIKIYSLFSNPVL